MYLFGSPRNHFHPFSKHAWTPSIFTQEWKLRETRRRHIDELARLSESSSGRGSQWTLVGTVGAGTASSCGSIYEISPEFRGGGAGSILDSNRIWDSSHEVNGPVLVSCRRDCGAHRIRLWVEDRATMGSARVHALDEATGAKMYRDIPDAALSRLLAAFKRAPSCDPDDVDDFLRAMLAACRIRMFPGGIDVILPSEEDLQPAAKPAPLNLRVMQHISAMATGRRPISSQQPSSPSSPVKVPFTKSTPCVAVVPPFGVAPVMPVAAAHAPAGHRHTVMQSRPPRPSKPPGRPPATPRRASVRRVRPQSAPHTGRTEEPRSSEAMEAKAKADSHGIPMPQGASLGFRGRRARPTSAKALKHRRVVDDSVDSIIYEDDEEEQEEMKWPSYAGGCETQPSGETSAQDDEPHGVLHGIEARNEESPGVRQTPSVAPCLAPCLSPPLTGLTGKLPAREPDQLVEPSMGAWAEHRTSSCLGTPSYMYSNYFWNPLERALRSHTRNTQEE